MKKGGLLPKEEVKQIKDDLFANSIITVEPAPSESGNKWSSHRATEATFPLFIAVILSETEPDLDPDNISMQIQTQGALHYFYDVQSSQLWF